MNDDAVLLRRYAEEGSEAAFTELVRRYVDLVYGAALRRTGDSHRAEDVAQQVFIALARDARKLSRHTVLGAWLHTATRNAALNLMISEQRREVRETAAFDPALAPGSGDPDWERLRPVLDAAIDDLPDTDRAAVVLRFLERRAFAEIGRALRVSEDAARMRTDRALEKLRTAFARRGITSTAVALGAAVSGQTLISAPPGLATALAAQSLAAGGASVGIFATAVSLMNLKIVTTAALSALAAFLIGSYSGLGRPAVTPSSSTPASDAPGQTQLIVALRQDNASLKSEISRLKSDIEQLDAANTELNRQRAAPPSAVSVAKSPNIGLPVYEMQRLVLNNLRQIDAARKQFQLENGRPAASVRDLVGVGSYIKTVRTVGGEDYAGLSMEAGQPLTVTTPDGVTVTFDPTGALTTHPDVPPEVVHVQELSVKVLKPSTKALEAYRSAHNGSNPPNEEAVLPYFASPQDAADFLEFVTAKRAAGL